MSGSIARRAMLVAVLAMWSSIASRAMSIEAAYGDAATDLVTTPPAVESLTLRLEHDARRLRLEVAMAADPRLGRQLRIGPLDAPITLRDDGKHGDAQRGDRIYTGTMPFDRRALEREVNALPASPRDQHGSAAVPLFSGREISRLLRPLKIDWRRLLSGRKLKIVPLDCAYAHAIDWRRSLLVTDRAVVADAARTYIPFSVGASGPGPAQGTPNGVWTFEHLIRKAAGAADPGQMLTGWMETWAPPTPPAPTPTPTPLIVNGWRPTPRPNFAARIVRPWAKTASGTLDVGKAPFQLLAIVNRVDKADGLSWAASAGHTFDPTKGTAGELRFVFGALAAESGAPLRFTVIFEYTVLQPDCVAFGTWARRWIDLSALPIGSPAYLDALQALTEEVVSGGHGVLARIRTNEVDLGQLFGGAVWDQREFHPVAGALPLTTVENTPDGCFNSTEPPPASPPPACVGGPARLAAYLNANPAPIIADHYQLPAQLPPPTPLLGAEARAKGALTYWDLPGIGADLRFHFSLGTCNGCHNRETETNSLHIDPMVPVGQPAHLSQFLTGALPGMTPTPVTDPRTGTPHAFNDLERRRQSLSQAATLPCLCDLMRVKLYTPH